MSTEMGDGGRLPGTCDFAAIFPVGPYTYTSISVPKVTDPSVQLITMDLADTVTSLQVSPSSASGRGFAALVLADFVVVLVAFQALHSSVVSFFLCCVNITVVVGHPVATREDPRPSTATAEASLVIGLLKPRELSFEAVNFVVLFIF